MMQSAPSLISQHIDDKEPAVVLEKVCKIYHMGQIEVPALNEVTLELPKGELIVFLGPSGSGKTTLLNIIGGLDSLTSGRVVIGGMDISHFNEARLTRARRTQTGFVFQFFNLIPSLTAAENVEVAAQLAGTGHLVDQLLAEVGLSQQARHFPAQLSGGEQQRVAIARALVTDAPIILCDEPTGNLDFDTGRRILKLMTRICRERNKTFLVVTHNAAIVRIAHRVIHLKDGRIVKTYENAEPMDPEELQW
jgi:putative ABC transport system ATP-binding protein